ncbi:MAG: DUF5752 family protein [Thermodesulfobacteriota bacterium]
MKAKAEPFKFYECTPLIKMTGRRAGSIVELLEILGQVTPESIFHHMHQYFLKPHVRPPAYPNDFAVWASEALEEKRLAERLANLNPFEFVDIDEVRGEIIRIIKDHLKEFPPPRPVLPGKEFFFNEGITFVIPTDIEATSNEEFVEALRKVDASSIYFHFYEARLRLGRARDDFSLFFGECLGCPGPAARLNSLDPYMYSTEVLREKIIAILEEEE